MLRTLVISYCSEDQAPYYPVIRVFLVFHNSFLDFLDSLSHFALFEKSEGPMSIAVMILWVVLLCYTTYSYCLMVILVHVVEEGKVAVSEGVSGFKYRALLQMVNCLVVLFDFEVSKTQTVLQLRIVRLYILGFLQSTKSVIVVLHFVEAHS